jgi:hypothetical protein
MGWPEFLARHNLDVIQKAQNSVILRGARFAPRKISTDISCSFLIENPGLDVCIVFKVSVERTLELVLLPGSFFHFEHPIALDILQRLNRSGWPADLHEFGLRVIAKTKVHGAMARGGIPDAGRHVVVLRAC